VTAPRPSPPVAGREPASPEPSEEAPALPQGRTKAAVAEIGGPKGPEPTRYGDWERNGRCSDF
jgi:hypothetical protein